MKDTEEFAAAHGLKWVQVEIYHAEVTALVSSEDAEGAAAALAKLRAVLEPVAAHGPRVLPLPGSGRADAAGTRARRSRGRGRRGRDRARERAAGDADPALPRAHCAVPRAPARDPAGARALRRGDRARHRLRQAQLRVPRAPAARAPPAARTATATARSRHVRDAARRSAASRATSASCACRPRCCRRCSRSRSPHGIETDYVRTLIRKRKLPPPGPEVADWPWPVALRTFGEFSIAQRRRAARVEGQGAEEAARAPEGADHARRPRRRRDDADRPRVARRRRRRRQDVVRQQSLSPAQAARHRRRARCSRTASSRSTRSSSGSTCGRSRPRSTPARSTPRSRCIAATSWRSMRRCRGRCPRATGCRTSSCAPCWPRATRSSASGEWARARSLYERTLEVDNLAEAIYRRLMVCLREEGNPSGALTAYRRCRELLSIVLGRAPSPETEAVRQSL